MYSDGSTPIMELLIITVMLQHLFFSMHYHSLYRDCLEMNLNVAYGAHTVGKRPESVSCPEYETVQLQ